MKNQKELGIFEEIDTQEIRGVSGGEISVSSTATTVAGPRSRDGDIIGDTPDTIDDDSTMTHSVGHR
jgi:hypothetical protein